MTSPNRPEFWPVTSKQYPFYNMREQEGLRTGSGMMYGVSKFTSGYNKYGFQPWKNSTKCWCTKCENSDSPSNVWWEFDLYTAAHLVFDDLEATHTTLRLFYDSNDSPVVIVNKLCVEYVNFEFDKCRLKCVTCDRNLGDKLEKMWEYYGDAWRKVKAKYKNYRSVNKLAFIVSHPHGCTKQVSIGQWKKKYKVGEHRQFTYTTSTCPGSSGAKVYCVGYRKTGCWLYNLYVHSGSISENNNFSAVGW